jgi:hypothetical protein
VTVLRFALLTSLFYICISAFLQVALLAISHFRAGVVFHATRLGWFALFGVLWYVSFAAAYHFLAETLDGRFFSR